jgi:hypothetical protein
MIGLLAMPLEILYRSFVFLSACPRLERSEVAALARFGVLLSRVQPVFA